MPVRRIQRAAQDASSSTPAGAPNWNSIRVNSSDAIVYGTGTSGTTEKTVVDLALTQTLTNKTLTAPIITAATVTGASLPVTASGGATVALTIAQSGGVFLFDAATGVAYTLPASPTVGLYYDFWVTVLQTSGTNSVTVNATPASTFLIGSLLAFSGENITPAVNVGPVIFNSPLASSFVKIATNGTTTGGGAGSWFRFVCASTTSWYVTGVVHTPSGTQATPFSV